MDDPTRPLPGSGSELPAEPAVPGEQSGGPAELRIERKHVIVAIGVALVLVLGTASLIGEASDAGAILDAIRAAEAIWFPLCIAGVLGAYAGYVMVYLAVAHMEGGPWLGIWVAIRVVALGFGASVVGSAAGAIAVDFWALRRAGERAERSLRRVLALNTVEWLVLALAASIAAAYALVVGSEAPYAMTLAWLVTAPFCLLAAWWTSEPARVVRIDAYARVVPSARWASPASWVRFTIHATRLGLAQAIGGVVLVRTMIAQPRRHFAALGGSALYWAGHLVTLEAALKAFGQRPPLYALILAFATGYVASALPLPAGGAGGIEAALAFALGALGLDLANALLAVLVYRAFTFWLPILPALLVVPRIPAIAESLDQIARERAAEPARSTAAA